MPPPWHATRSLLASKSEAQPINTNQGAPWLRALLDELQQSSKNRGVKTWHQHRPSTHLPAPDTAARKIAESLRQDHVKHREWREKEKAALQKELGLNDKEFKRCYDLISRYWEFERTLSDLERTGSTWNLDTLFKHFPASGFKLTSICPTILDTVNQNRLKTSVADTVARIARFTSKIDADSSGLKHVTTSSTSEADNRLLIDAVLKPLLSYTGLTFRCEVRVESRFLPVNRLDYCFYNAYGERVGLLEAKRMDLAQGFVQCVTQLLCLQAMDRSGDRPYFGIVSDGYHYILMVISGAHIHVDGPGHGALGYVRRADSWEELVKVGERIASLMLGKLPEEITTVVARKPASMSPETTSTETMSETSNLETDDTSSPVKTPLRLSILSAKIASPCVCQGVTRRCSPGRCKSRRKPESTQSPLKTHQSPAPTTPGARLDLALRLTTPNSKATPSTCATDSSGRVSRAVSRIPTLATPATERVLRTDASLLQLLSNNNNNPHPRPIPHKTTDHSTATTPPHTPLARSKTVPDTKQSRPSPPATTRSKSEPQRAASSSTSIAKRSWCVVTNPPPTLQDLHLHKQPQRRPLPILSSLNSQSQESRYHQAMKIAKYMRVQHVLVWPGDKSTNAVYQCLQAKLGAMTPDHPSTIRLEPFKDFVASCKGCHEKVERFLKRALAESMRSYGFYNRGVSDIPPAHVIAVYVDAGEMSVVGQAVRKLVHRDVSDGVRIGTLNEGLLIGQY
eukprot:TRINITY_DN8686_c0_g1_i3.p1 TRINITY_DN8686_c0_g1~~TRINITY_DN8686_c0_g1_i3.p1  ORF type:complete len:740 (+),score=123.76 TRINITY_DN8686_c0_g1_i3:41-2260(+)